MPEEVASSLEAYLAPLSTDRRALHSTLVGAIVDRGETPDALQELVFVASAAHPVFPDGEAVFWQAIRELMMFEPSGADELPLAWIGYHVMNRVTRTRQSQGILLTDRRVVTQDNFSVLFGSAAPRSYPLYVGPKGIADTAWHIAEEVSANFAWDDLLAKVPAGAELSMQLLVGWLTSALEIQSRLGVPIAVQPTQASDLRGRLRELGLVATAKIPDPNDRKLVKHFEKLLKKVPLAAGERVILSFTDSPIVGAPYGTVLTNLGVWSRDLMEEAVFTPLAQILPAEVRTSAERKYQLLLGPGEAHELPASLTDSELAGVVKLLSEWAAGDLSE